jgi:hypothetical protein
MNNDDTPGGSQQNAKSSSANEYDGRRKLIFLKFIILKVEYSW